MIEANDDREERDLVQRVRSSFPKEAAMTDAWVAERDLGAPCSWLESFADRTTEAIVARDAERVLAQLLAQLYLSASAEIQKLIDVSYAEPLMWNAGAEDKCWAWGHIARPVRNLHEALWGAPRC